MKSSKIHAFTLRTILVLKILLLLKLLVHLNSLMDQANYLSLKVYPIFNKFGTKWQKEAWIVFIWALMIQQMREPMFIHLMVALWLQALNQQLLSQMDVDHQKIVITYTHVPISHTWIPFGELINGLIWSVQMQCQKVCFAYWCFYFITNIKLKTENLKIALFQRRLEKLTILYTKLWCTITKLGILSLSPYITCTSKIM